MSDFACRAVLALGIACGALTAWGVWVGLSGGLKAAVSELEAAVKILGG